MNVYITGVGIKTDTISDIGFLRAKKINSIPKKEASESSSSYLNKDVSFDSKELIEREDRALLNKVAKLAIDTSAQCFSKFIESRVSLSQEDKNTTSIYTATEIMEYDLSTLDKLLEKYNDEDEVITRLGEMKTHLNPLDMLRLLSTNPLYHLSKLFGLHGGGYPVRRMSLSGLCALEMAVSHLSISGKKALVASVGDMTLTENLCAFVKMGLVKTTTNDNGIIPSIGGGSIFLEATSNSNALPRKVYARVIKVCSKYQPESFVKCEAWKKLYQEISLIVDINKLAIVLYNNGVHELAAEEMRAVNSCFPKSTCYSYKPYLGYTGKANNLIDIVMALSDERIPINSQILLNGVGTSAGIGCILIEKLENI